MAKKSNKRIIVLLVILALVGGLFYRVLQERGDARLREVAGEILQDLIEQNMKSGNENLAAELSNSEFKVSVSDVMLVKTEHNRYSGMATVSFLEGSQQFAFSAVTDGGSMICGFDNGLAVESFLTEQLYKKMGMM